MTQEGRIVRAMQKHPTSKLVVMYGSEKVIGSYSPVSPSNPPCKLRSKYYQDYRYVELNVDFSYYNINNNFSFFFF